MGTERNGKIRNLMARPRVGRGGSPGKGGGPFVPLGASSGAGRGGAGRETAPRAVLAGGAVRGGPGGGLDPGGR